MSESEQRQADMGDSNSQEGDRKRSFTQHNSLTESVAQPPAASGSISNPEDPVMTEATYESILKAQRAKNAILSRRKRARKKEYVADLHRKHDEVLQDRAKILREQSFLNKLLKEAYDTIAVLESMHADQLQRALFRRPIPPLNLNTIAHNPILSPAQSILSQNLSLGRTIPNPLQAPAFNDPIQQVLPSIVSQDQLLLQQALLNSAPSPSLANLPSLSGTGLASGAQLDQAWLQHLALSSPAAGAKVPDFMNQKSNEGNQRGRY